MSFIRSMIALGLFAPLVASQLVNGAFLPLFIEPGSDCFGWRSAVQAISSESLVKVFIVINPSNGPGLSYSQPAKEYQTCIPTLVAAGAQLNTTHVLGYVGTQYGQRDAEDVLTDIETYAGWDVAYRPEGIFFDHAPTGADELSTFGYYAGAVRSLFGTASLVSLNPSAIPDPAYFAFSDLILTVNEDYHDFNISNVSLSSDTPASKQILVLYNQPSQFDPNELTIVDQISAIAGIKACFITTSPKETEFTSVPPRWSQLLGELVASQTA